MTNTKLSLSKAINHAISLGIGEILISSIDHDGSRLDMTNIF